MPRHRTGRALVARMMMHERLPSASQKGKILTRRTIEGHGGPRRKQVRRFARSANAFHLPAPWPSVALSELRVESCFFLSPASAVSNP
jgi:hypothetical protein